MAAAKLLTGLVAFLGLVSVVNGDNSPKGDLILCDCGIGDDNEHPDWSTSRQMNWYNEIKWPNTASVYPNAPEMAVEIPYKDGIYPWLPQGVTGTLPNGDIWTAYIEDGTPDGFKAGSAVSSKDSKRILSCWAYRGRPISAAINKTVSHDAICWTAFVCNHENNPPPHPKDMEPPHTSTGSVSTAPPKSTYYTKPPKTVTVTSTSSGQPAPTQNPNQGKLDVYAGVNPRFINWQDTWQAFINKFVWDKNTGRCIGEPARGQGYNITIDCSGIQIDEDTHMTLLLIKALRDVGLNSLWFNQNPVIPGGSNNNQTSPNWVVMPEAFSLTATDVATNNVVGRLSYKTHYDAFLTSPCSTCETGRFNKTFFDPIIAAVQGSYPKFNNFTVQAQCDPWMVCE
ncbi:hypothetical protein QQS21_003075 [Conoideocrella luteorostrata]|uniref:Uncharacterized protein n=1 Tax=Conoideocrella luteorostrata TaxID=1105319 RepID=A0AAJ0G0V5_9HYPO|nr:hypothetical protein QQS21_003075 [Conoideocrella luteorostrata]